MPVLLGGPTHLTVGLIAAFVAVACIIAADTGAYFCGKSFGRTQVRLWAGLLPGQGWQAAAAAMCCLGVRWQPPPLLVVEARVGQQAVPAQHTAR